MNKRILINIALSMVLFASTQAVGQYNITMYQLNETLPQSHYLNPAFTPDKKVHVGLPVLSYMNVYVNNSFSMNDVLQRVNSDSLVIDYNGYVRGNLRKNNYTYLTQETSALFVGFRIPKGYISITAAERVDINANYPKALLDIFLSGNAHPDYFGKTTEFDRLDVKGMAWLEYAVAGNYSLLGDNLKVGLRLKYLKGMAAVSSSKGANFSLYTDPNSLELTMKTQDVVFNTAGLEALEGEDVVQYGLSSRNNGFGVDLGATYHLMDKINLSASIRDLGFITWKDSVKNYNISDQTYTFTGTDLSDSDDFFDAIQDTLETIFEPEETARSFRTGLSSHYYLGGTYHIDDNSTAGVLFQGKFVRGRLGQSITFSYTQSINKIVYSHINYSLIDWKPANLGLGLVFNFGFFQLYAMTDNIIPLINVDRAKNTSFQFGMNFNFGKVDN